MKAIEFFSGIGGFNQAAGSLGIATVAAFDQDTAANHVYQSNCGFKPICRNLDTIRLADIPSADCWWLSPPCTPYTVRGARRDEKDRRAQSILNLIEIASQLKPKVLIIENVVGFAESIVLKKFKETLGNRHYGISEIFLCPTQFGIPMRRPRVFVCAISGRQLELPYASQKGLCNNESTHLIADFLSDVPNELLRVDKSTLERYAAVLNIVDPYKPGEKAICFTSGYGKYWKASGSLIRMKDGNVRRFAPSEILKLLGFADDFRLQEGIGLTKQWKLVGNSVDLRSVQFVLNALRQELHF